MTRVEIRNPTGKPHDVRVLLDGVDVTRGLVSYRLTQAANGDEALPTLTLEILPRELAIELPDVLVKLRDEQMERAQSRSAFVENVLAEARAIDCPHGNKLDECTDEACYLVASRTPPSGILTGRIESMILAERDRVLAEQRARATVAAERTGADLSSHEKLLDAVAGDLATTVVGQMATRWAALPLAAQLAVMRFLRIATSDEVLDAENDATYARTLITSAFNRAATYRAVPDFERAIATVTKGIELAQRTGHAHLVPGIDLVFDDLGDPCSLEEWNRVHPRREIETVPTTSEGEE